MAQKSTPKVSSSVFASNIGAVQRDVRSIMQPDCIFGQQYCPSKGFRGTADEGGCLISPVSPANQESYTEPERTVTIIKIHKAERSTRGRVGQRAIAPSPAIRGITWKWVWNTCRVALGVSAVVSLLLLISNETKSRFCSRFALRVHIIRHLIGHSTTNNSVRTIWPASLPQFAITLTASHPDAWPPARLVQ